MYVTVSVSTEMPMKDSKVRKSHADVDRGANSFEPEVDKYPAAKCIAVGKVVDDSPLSARIDVPSIGLITIAEPSIKPTTHVVTTATRMTGPHSERTKSRRRLSGCDAVRKTIQIQHARRWLTMPLPTRAYSTARNTSSSMMTINSQPTIGNNTRSRA